VSELAACPRSLTAYHEAGHVVVGYVVGLACEWVNIKREHGRKGGYQPIPKAISHEDLCRLSSAREEAVGFGAVMMAGLLAELRLGGGGNAVGAGDDFRQAFRTAEALQCATGTTAAAFFIRMTELAEKSVDGFWPAIEVVAAALLEREHLSGREAEALIRGAELAALVPG
jgi:hypothetical protein